MWYSPSQWPTSCVAVSPWLYGLAGPPGIARRGSRRRRRTARYRSPPRGTSPSRAVRRRCSRRRCSAWPVRRRAAHAWRSPRPGCRAPSSTRPGSPSTSSPPADRRSGTASCPTEPPRRSRRMRCSAPAPGGRSASSRRSFWAGVSALALMTWNTVRMCTDPAGRTARVATSAAAAWFPDKEFGSATVAPGRRRATSGAAAPSAQTAGAPVAPPSVATEADAGETRASTRAAAPPKEARARRVRCMRRLQVDLVPAGCSARRPGVCSRVLGGVHTKRGPVVSDRSGLPHASHRTVRDRQRWVMNAAGQALSCVAPTRS